MDLTCSECDCTSFSQLLKNVMTANSAIVGFQGQHELSQQDTLASTKPEAAGAELEVQAECANPSIYKLSNHAPEALSVPHSAPAPLKPLLALQNDAAGLVLNQENSFCNTCLPHIAMETPTVDGYSWRKYGQKRVKSSESLRSYYRCTRSDCHARKKVQHCDHSCHVIDIVYMGHHNHDPPQKKCKRSSRFVSLDKLDVGDHGVDTSSQRLEGPDTSICGADARQSSPHMPKSEQPSSSCSNSNVVTEAVEQNGDEPEKEQFFCANGKGPQQKSSFGIAGDIQEKHGAKPRPKKRMKELHSVPVLEATEEPKIVVHSADVGISSDGYRWRKYGQKRVKGNSHLRSYFRCSSVGCPARKHVERATDDATNTTITYEGKHDHSMRVAKEQCSSEGRDLVTSSCAATNDARCKKTRRSFSHMSSNKWSVGTEDDLMGEKVLELGGEEALESAQALLSIGELRPC